MWPSPLTFYIIAVDITGYDSTVGLIESVDRPAIADAEVRDLSYLLLSSISNIPLVTRSCGL